MTWVVPAESHVLAALNAAETDNYRGHLATGQPDPLPAILAAVTDEVRGYVARQARLSAPGVPAALLNATVDLVIWRLAKRIQTQTVAQRKDAADAAYARLEAVARGDIALETDTLPDPPPAPPPAWGSAPRIGLRA